MAIEHKTVLCLASFFKGERFMQEIKRLGGSVILLTAEHLLQENWPRAAIDEVHALPDLFDIHSVVKGVSYLARTRTFDTIVALDDFDVETAARLREHLRVPGMGESTARYFRDKLAMRVQARDTGILAPRFVHVLNHNLVNEFISKIPSPWVLKPRSQASAVGIRKLHSQDELWQAIETLGDRQSSYLLEEFVPGDVYHVDSVVNNSDVLFSSMSKYEAPPLTVVQEGGIFCTRTISATSREAKALEVHNRKLISSFRLVRGVTHSEFIRSDQDNKFHFLETAARVGGAHIAELVEAATGINLWQEWANLEMSRKGTEYSLPPAGKGCAGLVLTLARQKQPDTAQYEYPEICWRLNKGHHVGFVVKSRSLKRVRELTDELMQRFLLDFHARMPAAERATY